MKIFIPEEVLFAFKRVEELNGVLNKCEKENRFLADNQVEKIIDELLSCQTVIKEFYESL
jgi:hypothetical protein